MKKKRTEPAPQLLPAVGARVGSVDGPGRFPKDNAGIVLCHVADRWGTHAVVLMDTGRTETVHGLTDVGIGWYLVSGIAHPAGYSLGYLAESSDHSMTMSLMLAPETDLDGEVRAWDLDEGRFVFLNGWMWDFEPTALKSDANQDCGPENS